MSAANLAELRPGDTVKWGSTTAKVLSNDGEKVTVENPDAGNVYGNRNRAPKTVTMKVTSKRMSALTGIPVAKPTKNVEVTERTKTLGDGTQLHVRFHGKPREGK